MIRWLILLMLMMTSSPDVTTRGLVPTPEPDVEAGVIYRVYVPMVNPYYRTMIEGADATLYGYATPHRRTYDVAYYNWRAIVEDCANENFWPMVRGQLIDPGMLAACDNGRRTLLIYNEPELGHFTASPKDAVLFVRDWSDRWTGPIACCGNFYGRVGGFPLSGLEWMRIFIIEYHIAFAVAPPINAIHMHVYAGGGLDLALLAEWRALADAYGWQIIVSESGVSTALTPEEAAAALPSFLATVEDTLRPSTLMWFSDYLQPWVLGDGTPWHILNLTNVDGRLTPVGEAWYQYIGQ